MRGGCVLCGWAWGGAVCLCAWCVCGGLRRCMCVRLEGHRCGI